MRDLSMREVEMVSGGDGWLGDMFSSLGETMQNWWNGISTAIREAFISWNADVPVIDPVAQGLIQQCIAAGGNPDYTGNQASFSMTISGGSNQSVVVTSSGGSVHYQCVQN